MGSLQREAVEEHSSSSSSSVQATIALWEEQQSDRRRRRRPLDCGSGHDRGAATTATPSWVVETFVCHDDNDDVVVVDRRPSTPATRRPDPPGPLEEIDYDVISSHPLLLQQQQQQLQDNDDSDNDHDEAFHEEDDPTVPWTTRQRPQRQRRQRQRPRYDFGQRRFCLSCSLLLVMAALILLFVLPLLRTGVLDEPRPLHESSSSSSSPPRLHWRITDGADRVAFQEFLVQRGISLRNDLDRDDSPQSRAIEWMTGPDHEPPFPPPPPDPWWKKMLRFGTHHDNPSPQGEFVSQELVDRYIVTVLYFALNGDSWATDHPLFLQEETHICNWWTTVEGDEHHHGWGWNNDDDVTMTMGVTDCESQDDGTMVPTAISLGTYVLEPFRIESLLEVLPIDNSVLTTSITFLPPFQRLTVCRESFPRRFGT
jgi:hypothetical protein